MQIYLRDEVPASIVDYTHRVYTATYKLRLKEPAVFKFSFVTTKKNNNYKAPAALKFPASGY